MNPALELRDVTVQFPARTGTVTALDRLSLSVPPGCVVGFVGPNGAGKTTALHVLLGFVAPSSGTAFIFGDNVAHSIARQKIGFLQEHPDTYRFLTGLELLHFTGRLFGMGGSRLRDRIHEVLALVNLEADARRIIGTYSRGMLQRICLAQTLLNDPDLVILDEPTGGLDPFGRLKIRELITLLRTRGKTVFFSSHELSEVELVCDRLAILAHGRLIAEGAVASIVAPGESLERFFMRVVTEAENGGRAAR